MALNYLKLKAMEPEIAFLMANLARVAAGTRVLDPFSGCCTLLMAAAHLQSMGPSLASANISMGFKNPEDIGERIAVAANDTIDAGIRSVDGDGDREVTAVENYLLGVDANMGDITRIHRNFHAVGRSASLASLSLRWDLAESLLEVIFCSILIYLIVLCAILFSRTLFCSVLLHSVLFYFVNSVLSHLMLFYYEFFYLTLF